MKSVNIFSITSIGDLSITQDCIKYLSTDAKDDEIKVLQLLCRELRKRKADIPIGNDFFIGFQIPQISKEFDLLRVGETVVNIELKTRYTDKVCRQLQRNRYYLRFLQKPLALFTYCAKENKIFTLLEDDLVETNFDDLISALENLKGLYEGNIDDLFNPSDYLVSPFNSTEKFLNGEYFLTSQQEQITDKTLEAFARPASVSVKGVAGTGKSLLLYHMASLFKSRSEKFLIVHSGKLNNGHLKLKNLGWPVVSIKELYEKLDNNREYSVVFIDESQRMKHFQYETLMRYAQENNSLLVFCHDGLQTLSSSELCQNLSDVIEETSDLKFELTEKIRTNKEIADFLNAILGRKHEKIVKSENADVVYFDTLNEAADYIRFMARSGWAYIAHTPSIPSYRIANEYDAVLDIGETGTAHEVISQEFDKVIAVIDDTFYYDENKTLQSHDLPNNVYLRLNMFFQAVTRVRQKIQIVVVHNLDVYKTILDAFAG